MKKLAALTLILMMTAALLSGCMFLKPPTALSLYQNTTSELDEAGGYELDVEMKMSIIGITFNIDGLVKSNGKNTYTEMTIAGETQISTVIDNEVYIESNDIKYKYELNENDPELLSTGEGWITSIDEKYFENVEITVNEDKSMTFTVIGDDELFSALLGSSADMLSSFGEDGSMTFKDPTLVFNYDEKGVITSLVMSTTYQIGSNGMSMEGDIDATYTFVNYGEAPKVSAPEDADDYITVDSDTFEGI